VLKKASFYRDLFYREPELGLKNFLGKNFFFTEKVEKKFFFPMALGPFSWLLERVLEQCTSPSSLAENMN
jgi:hypothetical protein